MRKILNFRFVYPIIFGLVFGILSSLYYYRGEYLKISLLVLAFFIVYSLLFLNCKNKLFIHFAVFLLFFILGFTIMHLTVRHYLSLKLPDGVYVVTGKVSSVRYYTNGSTLTLTGATLKSGYSLNDAKILLFVDDTNFKIGDKISCYANVSFVKNDFSNNYYLAERIPCTGEIISGTVNYLGSNTNLFEKVSLFIKDAIFNNMPKESAGICYALLTGNVSGMDTAVSDLYRFSGVFHIFSVSGLHISFLAHLIFKMTKKINIPQIIKSIFVIVVIFFYSGVCSFVACAMRSVVMCSFMLITTSFGKKYDILNSTLLSACVLLMINPFNLLNLGFLLSYLSVIGIIVLTRPISRLLKFIPGKLGESISVSVAATLSTLPVTLNEFGYFSPLSVLYNLIIVPIVYVVFLALIVFVFLSIIFTTLKLFIICDKLIDLTNLIVEVTTPKKYIVKGSMIFLSTTAYYSGITLYSDLFFIRPKIKNLVSSVLIGLAVILAVFA